MQMSESKKKKDSTDEMNEVYSVSKTVIAKRQ